MPVRLKHALPKLRVGILSSADKTLARGEKRDAVAVQAARGEVDAVEAACRANGWESSRIRASADPRRTIAALESAEPDVVFHLAESVEGDARLESLLATLLEGRSIPFTGSGPKTLWNALHKPLARTTLSRAGVSIPEGFLLERAHAPLPRAFRRAPKARWIVKPSREDASHGIAIESVVSGERALRARCAYVIDTYAQPALVEEFVEGREFNVSMIEEASGPRVLPLAEIDFTKFPAGAPKLVTFASKWIEGSAEHRGTPSVAARKLARGQERWIREAALGAWRALKLRGYGRVDMRLASDGTPRVIDVNPNPDISLDAGLAKAAARAGIDHGSLITRIIEIALGRFRSKTPPAGSR
ncbi:MAG TPA: ATP-grasp domain-containing protein [Planctomycetota bacterium]|jgi:D-alanine-D-alanine ligase|nr:ATP-grasp domain-containing protein [Planctomycetota bacterium]